MTAGVDVKRNLPRMTRRPTTSPFVSAVGPALVTACNLFCQLALSLRDRDRRSHRAPVEQSSKSELPMAAMVEWTQLTICTNVCALELTCFFPTSSAFVPVFILFIPSRTLLDTLEIAPPTTRLDSGLIIEPSEIIRSSPWGWNRSRGPPVPAWKVHPDTTIARFKPCSESCSLVRACVRIPAIRPGLLDVWPLAVGREGGDTIPSSRVDLPEPVAPASRKRCGSAVVCLMAV